MSNGGKYPKGLTFFNYNILWTITKYLTAFEEKIASFIHNLNFKCLKKSRTYTL